jgi:hypothetical protein
MVRQEMGAAHLPNPSLITEPAEIAALIWIMKGGLVGGPAMKNSKGNQVKEY